MTTTREEAIELVSESGLGNMGMDNPFLPSVIRLIDLAKRQENEAIAQEYESAGWTFQAEAIRARMKP